MLTVVYGPNHLNSVPTLLDSFLWRNELSMSNPDKNTINIFRYIPLKSLNIWTTIKRYFRRNDH